MSEKYKFLDKKRIYFTTSTIVFWIDLFTRKELKHVIVESLRYCQKELIVHAWCLMPSHLHMIVSSETSDLSSIFADFKKFTAKEIVKTIKTMNESRSEWLLRAFENAGKKITRVSDYKVWQDGNHPILLESADIVKQKINYIHMNPVNDEIVDEPQYYWYSSARNYQNDFGLLKVSCID